MTFTYLYVRNGTTVCERSQLETALEYARRDLGWHLHLGQKPRTVRVEEQHWNGYQWKPTGQTWDIPESEAVDLCPRIRSAGDPDWLIR